MLMCVSVCICAVTVLLLSFIRLQNFTRTHTRSGMQRVWFDRKILDLSGKNVCVCVRERERAEE